MKYLKGADRAAAARKAADLYNDGNTIRSVGQHIGRSYDATRSLLVSAGVKLRKPGDRGSSARKARA